SPARHVLVAVGVLQPPAPRWEGPGGTGAAPERREDRPSPIGCPRRGSVVSWGGHPLSAHDGDEEGRAEERGHDSHVRFGGPRDETAQEVGGGGRGGAGDRREGE